MPHIALVAYVELFYRGRALQGLAQYESGALAFASESPEKKQAIDSWRSMAHLDQIGGKGQRKAKGNVGNGFDDLAKQMGVQF